MRLAIVHDYLTQGVRGAERVLQVLHRMYPEAPVYTLVYDRERMGPAFEDWDIRTSFLQRIPFGVRQYQKLFPLMPRAVASLDLRGYDVVLSASSAWVKSVQCDAPTLHLCYCYSPARFLWHWSDEYVRTLPCSSLTRSIVRRLLPRLRDWDRATVQHVDEFATISQTVRQRIRRYYGREAAVIYPPVNTDAFRPVEEDEDYFLIVSALNPYKRVDLAIEAFNQLRLPLVVIGDGPCRAALEQLAGPTVRLLGRLPDPETVYYYQRCRGFIMPQEEDFGLTAVEAQAAGRPVIAFGRGGATETVKDGETGVIFPEQRADSLAEAVLRATRIHFSKQRLRAHARQFDTSVFQRRLGAFIADWHRRHRGRAYPASQPSGDARPQPAKPDAVIPSEQESVV